MEFPAALDTLDDVRNYVAETLAGYESLDPAQWQLRQQVLYRSGKPCGMHFCMQGPRSLTLSAIWEFEGNSILFYRSCGARAGRVQLVRSPLSFC
jgi:hypothetical protein